MNYATFKDRKEMIAYIKRHIEECQSNNLYRAFKEALRDAKH